MKKRARGLCVAALLLVAFALWTVLVCAVDVQPIGPNGTAVGFATLNSAVHRFTGVHMELYVITDWLGLVPIALALGFAALGLCQWMRRKSPWRVDRSILVLGGFYVAVAAAYIFFEMLVINYRPILIDGRLEASYPSSTTVLVLCVMPTAAMQLRARIRHRFLRRLAVLAIALFSAFTVGARLFSGVHWFTDIVGGVLLCTGLVGLYAALAGKATDDLK